MSFENKKNKIKTLKAFTDVKKIIIANNYEYQYEDIDYTNNLYGPIKVMIDPNDEDTLIIGNKANILMQYLIMAELLEIKIPEIIYNPIMKYNDKEVFKKIKEEIKDKLEKKIDEESITKHELLSSNFLTYIVKDTNSLSKGNKPHEICVEVDECLTDNRIERLNKLEKDSKEKKKEKDENDLIKELNNTILKLPDLRI